MATALDDPLAELLSRYPGPVTLAASRAKWLWLIVIGVAFIACGAWLIGDPAALSDAIVGRAFGSVLKRLGVARDSLEAASEIGWVTAVFFGLCTLIGIVSLLPGASGLTLAKDGLATRTLFRRRAYRWIDVSEIAAVALPTAAPHVGFNDASAAGTRAAALNVKLTGRNAMLSDDYGFPADELARLMLLWRDRALASRS